MDMIAEAQPVIEGTAELVNVAEPAPEPEVVEVDAPQEPAEQPVEPPPPPPPALFSLYVTYAVDGLQIAARCFPGVRAPQTPDELRDIVTTITQIEGPRQDRSNAMPNITILTWQQLAGQLTVG